MADLKFDVLGIGNAIVDVIARAEDDFLVAAEDAQGRHGADRRGARRGDLRRDGAGGGDFRRLGGQHHRRRRGLRRARGVRRQGQGRRARPRLRPRHPRRGRGLRHAAGRRRSLDRALLRDRDARRRAHHEHLSRRGAGPASDDVDPDTIGAAAITYLEGYLWDPPHAKDAFRKAATDRAWRRPAGGADAVGCVLRRPLPRRVRRTDPHRHRRSRVRQRARIAEPLPDRRLRHRDEGAARRRAARGGDAQREGLRRGRQEQHDRGAGDADRARGRCHRRGRPVRRGLPVRARARPRPPHLRRGSACWPPPR